MPRVLANEIAMRKRYAGAEAYCCQIDSPAIGFKSNCSKRQWICNVFHNQLTEITEFTCMKS